MPTEPIQASRDGSGDLDETPGRIRIVQVISRLNVGGPVRPVVWVTEALNDEQYQSVLVTGTVPPGEEDMTNFAVAHGVKPIVIPEMSREISPRDLLTVWKMFQLFRRIRPVVVHTHAAKAGFAGRIAGLLYRMWSIGRPRQRCRFVHTYHGHIFHSYYGRLKTQLFISIERALARLNTDRIIVVSEQQFEEIHATFRIGRREQYRIVRYGVDTDEIGADTAAGAAIRRELRIAPETVVIGIIGRLTAIKNHNLFLESAASAGPRIDEKEICYVIYGGGADREELERRAADLGVTPFVRFAGTRRPAEIYGSVDIVAQTSLNEGMPLTLIEAMANGKPVVSTVVGGVIDLLGAVAETVTTDGGTYQVRERGLGVASGDVRGFTAALKRITTDVGLALRLAKAGRAYVDAALTKDRHVEDIMRVYRELTDSRALAPSLTTC